MIDAIDIRGGVEPYEIYKNPLGYVADDFGVRPGFTDWAEKTIANMKRHVSTRDRNFRRNRLRIPRKVAMHGLDTGTCYTMHRVLRMVPSSDSGSNNQVVSFPIHHSIDGTVCVPYVTCFEVSHPVNDRDLELASDRWQSMVVFSTRSYVNMYDPGYGSPGIICFSRKSGVAASAAGYGSVEYNDRQDHSLNGNKLFIPSSKCYIHWLTEFYPNGLGIKCGVRIQFRIEWMDAAKFLTTHRFSGDDYGF